MSRLLWRLGATGLLLAAAPALATDPFDGTWKAQLSSLKMDAKPDVIAIRNGTYSCTSCKPAAYSIPADGKFHHVADKDYWDDLAVTVVDDHTVNYKFRKAGKVISDNTDTVSADGLTLNSSSHNTNNGGNVPIDATSSAQRIGQPVPGAHLVSGSWRSAPASSVSDAALTVTMSVVGDRLHRSVGLGESLDATIGGPYALNKGDPGKTMTKVERLGPRSLKFTDMRGGKVTSISTYTVSDDGATLSGSSSNTQDGSTTSFTAVKQ